jgi:vitamin B12 transporter
MPTIRTYLLAFTAIAAVLPQAARADARDADASTGEDIVVSALRIPVAQDRIASSIIVLDRAAIEQQQPLALTDLLVRTPGISLSRNGGYGTATSLRIRGADAGQTVMVIDGMRLADPSATAGGYGFANLFIDDLARVEILRGPQSILWGSDAIGGVINVQTARPTKPLEGSASAEAGTHRTIGGKAAVGGASDRVDWRLSGSTFYTDGISARANGTEPDGYRRKAANGAVTIRPAANVSLDLRGYWAEARNDFDGTSGDAPVYGNTREWSAYAGLNVTLLDGRFTNRLAILHSDTDRENFDPRRKVRAINFDANGRVRRYEYQGSFAFSDAAQIVFGAEREEQRMTSASPDDSAAPYALQPDKANTNSIYGELRLTPVAGLTLNGGVRHDDQSRFGGNTVFSAGAVWSLARTGTLLRASYDEGYKAPSLYQLFSMYGSAALKPEEAKGWEVGIEQDLGETLRLSATWFDRDTDNLIDFAYCPTSGALPDACYVPGTATTRFGYYANVRKSHARGLELGGSLRHGGLFASGNYSWIAAEDRTPGGTYGVQLARVPRHLANGELGYAFGAGIKASVAVRYSGKTFDRSGSSFVLDDYRLTDLRAEWKLIDGLTLYGRVENVGNVHYQTASGYGSLGRTVYAGFRSRF